MYFFVRGWLVLLAETEKMDSENGTDDAAR